MRGDGSHWNPGIEYAALSDIGLRRTNNQDAMSVVVANSLEHWQERGHLLLVADGMGAHAAGELASKLAADNVSLTYNKLVDQPPPQALREAVREANRRIHDRGQANSEFRGMGTTISALLLLPEGAIVAHVGDSRVYRLRGDRLEQLSFDHSLVWEMQSSGRLSEVDVASFVPKNIITRSLGPNPTVEVDVEGPYTVEAGDTFLLCSDGLSGQVADEELGALLRCLSPDEAVHALVDLANLRGGPDNITVIVARVTQLPERRPVPESWQLPAAEPETRPPGEQPIRATGWWLLALGLGVVAVLLGLGGVPLLGLAAGLSAVFVAVIALLTSLGSLRPRTAEAALPAFGRGPYTSTDCPLRPKLVEDLAQVVREVREAAEEKEWRLNWDRVAEFESQAVQALEAGDLAEAVHARCRAISFLMQQVKEQAGRTTSPRGTP